MAPLTPLVRPDRFFAECDLDGFHVLVVLTAVIFGMLAIFYGIGWVMTDRIDGTVRVDNPERPSDMFCESDFDFGAQDDCSEPKKIERNVDPLLWDAWGSMIGRLLIGLPILWLLLGALLHAGSWLAGGENGAFPSFGVAAWGLVPSLAGGIVAVVVVYATFDPITVTPANQETVLETAKASLRGVRSVGWLLTVLTSAWTAIIWRFGLEHERGLSGMAAWSVAASVAAILVVFGLA